MSIRDADSFDAERGKAAARIRRQHLLRVAAGIAIVVALFVAGVVIQHQRIFSLAGFLVALVFVMKPDFYKFSLLEFAGCPVLAVLVTRLPSTRDHALGMILIAIGLLSFFRGAVSFFRYMGNSPSLNQ